MSVTTYSAMLHGLKPIPIEVELDTTPGLPGFVLIGLPGQAIGEAKERITAALNNCGIKIKAKRVVVNLAPADLRKTSSVFELAIIAGLLQLYGEIPAVSAKTIFYGELSLSGEIRPIKGALPLVLAARELGFEEVILPAANAQEAIVVSDITIRPISHLSELIAHQKKTQNLQKLQYIPFMNFKNKTNPVNSPGFYNIIGQPLAKRALEIAAAGGHNVFLIGPPGTGKSMLSEALTTILPPLTEQEAIEVSALHSIAGQTISSGLVTNRPFRKIHHTISQTGLVGGTSQLTPGEISLAHRGILFMDEFTEFPRYVLEALRQPLETKSITISRAAGTVQYPANFTLLAAANPCPCGYFGSQKKACTCSEYHLQAYRSKISGPILDRIDMSTWVGEVDIKQVSLYNEQEQQTSNETEKVQKRVVTARIRQKERFKNHAHLTTNSDMTVQDIRKFCKLEPKARQLLLSYTEKHHLSLRQYYRIIKVAQTIADLSGEEIITQSCIAQSLQFRAQVY